MGTCFLCFMKIWKNIKRPPILVISTSIFIIITLITKKKHTRTRTQKHLELVHEALTIRTKFQIKLEVIQNQDFLFSSIYFFSFKCLNFIQIIFFVIYNHILNSLLQILLFKNLCPNNSKYNVDFAFQLMHNGRIT